MGTREVAEGVDRFVTRAQALEDDDRVSLAEARGRVDETFQVGAWKAATEIAAERAQLYFDARLRVGAAFIPQRLEELVELGSAADPAELHHWQDVARLARAGLEEALLARIVVDLLPPPDLRALYGPWTSMLEAAQTDA